MPATIHRFPSPPRPSSKKMKNPVKVPPIASSSSSDSPSSSCVYRMSNGIDSMSDTSGDNMDCDSDYEDDDEADMDEIEVHVEVRLHESTHISAHQIRPLVKSHIESNMSWLRVDGELGANNASSVSLNRATLVIHVYKVVAEDTVEHFVFDGEEDDDEQVSGGSVRKLPSAELEGLWENLIYPDDIKGRLLRYVASTATFSDAGIDFNIVSWNRMILLHGPPGTGKTSLCRALAQKVLLRTSDRYSHGRLIEINSHSLFSKWFSESGKLVQRIFSSIHDLAEDAECLVVVVIDEVESLTAARSAAMNGNEPGDAVRVVNALLTQLDKLKTKGNVLVMATSNIAGAIADLKEYVGLPPPEAIYWILGSCLAQMVKGGLIAKYSLPTWMEAKSEYAKGDRSDKPGTTLFRLATVCHQREFSGRFLRRLPLLAHAKYMSCSGGRSMSTRPRSMKRWLEAMDKVIQDEQSARKVLAEADGHMKVAVK